MEILKKFKKKYNYIVNRTITSDDFNNYLKKKDIIVGSNTVFYGANSILVDTQRPWLIKIGAYTKITQGTIILQHDYSRSVLRRKYGDLLCEAGQTVIGDNCFIGMNSIILMGTHIGNNVIVGAGSVVSGNIPDDVVIAGNPARIIRTLDEHYAIRKSKQVEEAKICAIEFYNHYKKIPTIHDMGAFFPLYLKRDINEIKKNNLSTKLGGDSEEEVINSFLNSKPIYDDYDSFLDDTFKDIDWRNIK